MLSGLKDTWNDLRKYLPRPYDKLDETATLGHKIGRLFSVLAIDLGGAVLLMLLLSAISELGLLNMEEHAVADAFSSMSTTALLLMAGVAAPLLEEFFFRFPLRFEANPFMGLARVFAPFKNTTAADGDEAERRQLRRANLRSWWDRNYRWIFYLSAILFAYVHISNFKINATILLLSPLLVAAQFWMGSLSGYLRARYGFVWSLLLHGIHNLILIGGTLLVDGPTEVFAIDNEEYHLRIEEASMLEDGKNWSDHYRKRTTIINGDTIASKSDIIDSVAYVNPNLSTLLPILLKDEYDRVYFPPDATDPKVNLYFGRENSTEDEKDIIVDALAKHYKFKVVPDSENELRATIEFE